MNRSSRSAPRSTTRESGHPLDSWDTSHGTAWRGRVEHCLTNPATEPDPAKWEVDLAYLTTGT
jgi:hypothetical protein